MTFPILYDITNQEWIKFSDIEKESHFIRFPSLANKFILQLRFPTDISENINYIDCGIGLSSEIIDASQRFVSTLKEVTTRYRPFIWDRDPLLFPNIHFNCAIKNIVGFFDEAEIKSFHETFSTYNPMICILTQVQVDEPTFYNVFKQYGYDRTIRLNQVVNNDRTYILWRGSQVDILFEDYQNLCTLKVNARCMEPWQLSCINQMSPEVAGLNLWQLLEGFTRVTCLPWKYLNEMKEIINLSDQDSEDEDPNEDPEE